MTTVVSFVVVIGLLILIHELGHFVVARLAGVGVERFSIGFGPVLWRYRGKETEYCLSAIPMGGYVKMMGDDENPLEGGGGAPIDPGKAFTLKPLPVRFLIVFAGPAMNLVLPVLLFALVFVTIGRPVLPPVVGRVAAGTPAASAGLQAGERIVAIDGVPVRWWEDVLRAVQESDGRALDLTVAGASGERRVTVVPASVTSRDVFGDPRRAWDLGARPLVAPVIGDVVAGYPAAQAGLRGGDVVVSIDGQAVASWDDLAEAIQRRAGQPIRLAIRRDGELRELTLTPVAVKDRGPDGAEIEVGRIGISPAPATTFVRSGPLTALREGLGRTVEVTVLTAAGLYKIVVGQLDRSNIGGPIQIAVAAGEQARQGPAALAFFTAVISVNLALLNLLPVPMLDGGHLLFFLIEGARGRPLSIRTREIAQQVGFALLLLLMVYAVYNDLARIDMFRFLR